MRFIHLYLIVYFVLIFSAAVALWKIGAFQRISPLWMVITAIVVIGLGVLLAVTSVRPRAIE